MSFIKITLTYKQYCTNINLWALKKKCREKKITKSSLQSTMKRLAKAKDIQLIGTKLMHSFQMACNLSVSRFYFILFAIFLLWIFLSQIFSRIHSLTELYKSRHFCILCMCPINFNLDKLSVFSAKSHMYTPPQ